jgi:glutathione S-transferase
MKLLIGNKNYSSWSLRPWLLLKQLEIPFEEEALSFNDPAFKSRVKRHSPVGRVPVLVDDEIVVWDSLAIVEYVAEKFPDRGVWPAARAARARARSICAEMHAGFQGMRDRLSMNCELCMPGAVFEVGVRREIARVLEMWGDCRARFGAGGPFLFGAFSAADAYYAPVVRRFVTYDVKLPDVGRRYVEAIDALPSMQAWLTAALAEHDFVDFDEPYREPTPRAPRQ